MHTCATYPQLNRITRLEATEFSVKSKDERTCQSNAGRKVSGSVLLAGG